MAIQTEQLTKIYTEVTRGGLVQKKRTGVRDLNLEVKTGEVFAFLGPNGAGKSTTIKLLTRLIFPTNGRAFVMGIPTARRVAMRRVGYLPEQPNIYGYLTGREFLHYVAKLCGLSNTDARNQAEILIRQVGLEGRADSHVRSYSRGMTQRLGLAQALVHDPDLLILDEPLSNLDPIGRKEVRDLILELKKQGKTIFFSSHILSDAELVADRVAILNMGRLIRTGKMDALDAARTSSVEITFQTDETARARMDLTHWDAVCQDMNIMIRIEDAGDIPKTLKQIEQWGGKLVSVIPQRQSLEEYFMAELGR